MIFYGHEKPEGVEPSGRGTVFNSGALSI